MTAPVRTALTVQGLFYVVTGLWPLVSLSTFEFVTGPKTDDWLVHMVGLQDRKFNRARSSIRRTYGAIADPAMAGRRVAACPPPRLGGRPDGVARGRPVAAGADRTPRWDGRPRRTSPPIGGASG